MSSSSEWPLQVRLEVADGGLVVRPPLVVQRRQFVGERTQRRFRRPQHAPRFVTVRVQLIAPLEHRGQTMAIDHLRLQGSQRHASGGENGPVLLQRGFGVAGKLREEVVLRPRVVMAGHARDPPVELAGERVPRGRVRPVAASGQVGKERVPLVRGGLLAAFAQSRPVSLPGRRHTGLQPADFVRERSPSCYVLKLGVDDPGEPGTLPSDFVQRVRDPREVRLGFAHRFAPLRDQPLDLLEAVLLLIKDGTHARLHGRQRSPHRLLAHFGKVELRERPYRCASLLAQAGHLVLELFDGAVPLAELPPCLADAGQQAGVYVTSRLHGSPLRDLADVLVAALGRHEPPALEAEVAHRR